MPKFKEAPGGEATSLTGEQIMLVGADDLTTPNNYVKLSTLASYLLRPVISSSDPTVNDDLSKGYSTGQRWVNSSTKKSFVCYDDSVGSAFWANPDFGNFNQIYTSTSELVSKAPNQSVGFLTEFETVYYVDDVGGIKLLTYKNNQNASGAPTVNDDITAGYQTFSLSADKDNDRIYICFNPEEGAANWIKIADANQDPFGNEFVSAFNDSGASYSPLTAVYVKYDSVTDNRREAWKAQANNLNNLDGLIGVLPNSIDSGISGNVLLKGVIENIDTSAYQVDDILYVSDSSAGALTTTKPTGENFVVEIGRVSVKDAIAGKIEINVKSLQSAIVNSAEKALTFDEFQQNIGSPLKLAAAICFNQVTGAVQWSYNVDSLVKNPGAVANRFQLNNALGFGNNLIFAGGVPQEATGYTAGASNNIVTVANDTTGYNGVTSITFNTVASAVSGYDSKYVSLIIYNGV